MAITTGGGNDRGDLATNVNTLPFALRTIDPVTFSPTNLVTGGVYVQQIVPGPVTYQDPSGLNVNNLYFAVLSNGRMYAVDMNTGIAQPVFTGGSDTTTLNTIINGGVQDVAGLYFSPLDANLWHLSQEFNTDVNGNAVLQQGHGFNALDNQSRSAIQVAVP